MHIFKFGAGLVAATVIGFAGAAQAAPITLDFEDLTGASQTVTNQYQAFGVVFNGTSSLSSGFGLSGSFPPASGDTVLYDTPGQGGTITATAFNKPWTSAGAFVTGNTAVTLTAFDSGGNVIDSVSTPGANYVGAGTGFSPNIWLEVTGNIAYVTFSDGGNTYTIDDFTFTPIPLPAPVWMGLAGLGGVVCLRRRRLAAA